MFLLPLEPFLWRLLGTSLVSSIHILSQAPYQSVLEIEDLEVIKDIVNRNTSFIYWPNGLRDVFTLRFTEHIPQEL